MPTPTEQPTTRVPLPNPSAGPERDINLVRMGSVERHDTCWEMVEDDPRSVADLDLALESGSGVSLLVEY